MKDLFLSVAVVLFYMMLPACSASGSLDLDDSSVGVSHPCPIMPPAGNVPEDHLPKVIAHRGFFMSGVPQNSIAALSEAQKLGVYGSEVDLRITEDGVVVCHHGPFYAGMNIASSTYEMLRAHRLENGEELPTLESMLDQLSESSDTRLVLDFKATGKRWSDNLLVNISLSLIRKKNLEHMIDYLSEDYDICRKIAGRQSGSVVGYVCSDADMESLSSCGIDCICVRYSDLELDPGSVDSAHDSGLTVNVWTVNCEEDMIRWLDAGVDYITTDHPDRLCSMIYNSDMTENLRKYGIW